MTGPQVAETLRRVSNRPEFKYVYIDWTALGAAMVEEIEPDPLREVVTAMERSMTEWIDSDGPFLEDRAAIVQWRNALRLATKENA